MLLNIKVCYFQLVFFFAFVATFLKEVSNKSQSFNMLVFHQKSIVECLKTNLAVKDSLASQPLLEYVFCRNHLLF